MNELKLALSSDSITKPSRTGRLLKHGLFVFFTSKTIGSPVAFIRQEAAVGRDLPGAGVIESQSVCVE